VEAIVTPGADEVVLATKLFPPRARHDLVVRERLLDRLRRGLDGPLTVVVAPAGWGKSTLVSNLLRTDGVPAGWVSLDHGDDDPKRFWRYLLLAASRAVPGAGDGALRRLDAAGADVRRDVVPTFVNDLLGGNGPMVLALDDYHLITNREVHASVDLLVEHGPPDLHLVLMTRADPPLPLPRLRVRGQLLEMRAEHLGFTTAEADELLNDRLGLGLDREDVERLVTRTEGWAAALQLAALRLRDHADPRAFVAAFSGADRHLVDYLGEEVLSTQPPAVRDFLLRTSVLERLSAPLCDAVTGSADAVDRLDDVMHGNLFLIRLDDEDRWFRYHHLFAGLLRHELGRVMPGQAAELRRRAALWHADHGDVAEAVEYAIAARDADLSARLVGAGWQRQFNAGQWETVQAWLASLPVDAVRADPALSRARTWIALDNGRLEEAAAALDDADAAGPPDVHLQLLRAIQTYKSGDLSAASRALAALDPADRDADPMVRTVHRLVTGLTALWSGAADTAEEHLAAAARYAADDGNRLAEIYATGCRALAALNRDEVDEAGRFVEAASRGVDESLSDAHFIAAFPVLARARLALRTGDAEAALPPATAAVELARRGAGRGEVAAALLTASLVARNGADAGDGGPAGTPGAATDGRGDGWAGQARTVLKRCPDPGPVLLSWLAGEHRATGSREASHRPGPAEELTERELAILRLLPGTASQRELAAMLFITPNTLKTHLRAIYRKLGVDSRPDAVLRGRAAGLL
jgi:LuxR family maltose regulon positive regulatory protein